MGIIVGMIALKAGIIHSRLFVALIIMAMATSMLSGPSLRMVLQTEKKLRLRNVLSSKLFLRDLKATSRREVIHELTLAACAAESLDAQEVENAVWSREEALSTGIGKGVAIPHARIDGLRRTLVAVGVSGAGIDFDAPDDKLASVIFLILTPRDDPGAQLDIASEIARLFRDQRMIDNMGRVENFTDLLALVRAGSQENR
jgi:mannitol/fructose-specific phosphotransferase system IIA component (Ntr-type)